MTRPATRPQPHDLHLTTAHPLQACWDLQLGGLGADALHLALAHGLFDHLQQFKAAAQLAQALDWHVESADYFLELLWSLDLLERDAQRPARYRNRPLADRHLRSSAAQYCGDALMFRHRVLRETGAQLDDYLRNGMPRRSPTTAQLDQGWANAARLQIAQEQRAVTCDSACALLASLPEYPRLHRLLDLGGGPGLVAIALARQLPALGGVVFEYPETARVAAANIDAAGLGTRLSARGADLDSDDIGSGYDLIWCSSVLHFVHDLPATLQRLHAALAPGGVLVCCQAEVPQARHMAAQVLPYYLHMRLQGRHVLAEGELAALLRDSGWRGVEQIDGVRYPLTPVTAVIARKAKE
ncbi:class I SAM-dependent methyltransferase [Pseudomonas sp. S75]|uniref:class I SAM-dependent methyltransferase n=1 Tax=unclassified Pseudomonas TaxID=196821 RepID=UPI001904FB0F|nr:MULTISPECIES: class I SAM-dependent methyltransferase [unclassified Pseudomonas]MBJ9977099.1 class I SAM-dependent methyltransferase [Pseudomonas sp. S30]MBK0154101.1 class I SAM-dependent methyltransferase [Pseudomonas sp. S75]